jgi:type IV secretory pathway VirB3-like protein
MVLKFLNGFRAQKSKDSNIFELGLNWIQTRIKLNKLFRYFSKLV